ncbi:DUF6647 family protein [Roseovarius pacificus]|uniref:DUF6647 family protein n=1 Tax=Roseovarius pacificus TaxID=337701 RepID=UPI0040397CEC
MNIATNEFSEFVLFSENENNALDSRSETREVRGKQTTYVNCLVRNKAVQLKPEERTRQLWLARLIDQYGYSPSRITTLVSTQEEWLDAQADWPRRDVAPRVLLVSAWQAAARWDATASFQRGRLRALYDPDRSEILLVRPWDPSNALDVSVLLHELVHHRQAPHHWYCPAAQELSAYRLQEAWLVEQGLSIDVNWVAVVLDAGCTPQDIHPE